MPRSYPYGKVPSSVGTVISERFETPMVDCGYCSTQFAARASRTGISSNGKVEGHVIRARGGRAHNAGSTSAEQRLGVRRGFNVTVTGITKSAILARVKQGFTVTVSLQYVKLPAYLKVQTNDFGHCVALKGYSGSGGGVLIGYFDPLYLQGSQGSWARWADLQKAIWDSGHNTTTVKR
jgi:hypothetical protein